MPWYTQESRRQVSVPVTSVQTREQDAAFSSTFDVKGSQMQVWTFAALTYQRFTLKREWGWKHMCIFIQTCCHFWEEHFPRTFIRDWWGSLTQRLHNVDSTVQKRGLWWNCGLKQLALSYLAVLSFDALLVNTKAYRVSSLLAPSPSLPTHREVSQAFLCCAHCTFLSLLGICTCIVQFCWQKSFSHFWRIYKAFSGPGLGPDIRSACLPLG